MSIELIRDVIWSITGIDEGINDLIGISDSSVYIWDPIQACEPMEMRFQFNDDMKITCIGRFTNHSVKI